MSGLVRLNLRRHRIRLLAWIVPLSLLMIVTPIQYVGIYPDLASRQVLVEQMQTNKATELLYGPLASPGTLGQLAQWESGAYVMLLGCLMAVLLAVAMTRAGEDAGTAEIVQTLGLPVRAPITAALTVLLGACLTLGATIGLGMAAASASVDELTLSGGLLLGTTVAVASSVMGLLTLVLAQLPHDAHTARRFGLAALGGSFTVRTVADAVDQPWLRWLSPLGWKDVVAPYTDDRAWPLLVFTAVGVALGWLAVRLDSGRELGGGYLPRAAARLRHSRARSPLGLSWRLARGSWISWSISVVGLAVLFGAMTRSMLEIIESDEKTSDMMALMTGIADPLIGFFDYLGVMLGLVVTVYATMTVMAANRRENDGLLDVELATGPRRWSPLLAQAIVASLGSAAILALAGLGMAAIAETQAPGRDAFPRVLTYVVGNVPGVLAVVGLATLILAIAPGRAFLAWLPAIASPVITIFGTMLGLPDWMARVSVLGHVPDVVTAQAEDFAALGALAVVATLALPAAAWWMARRDIAAA